MSCWWMVDIPTPQDVNDVYMTSVEQRQKEEGKDFPPKATAVLFPALR